MLDNLTRLKLRGEDFRVTYEFDNNEPVLRIAIRPLNEWSQLAFKTVHECEIEDEAKENAKVSA